MISSKHTRAQHLLKSFPSFHCRFQCSSYMNSNMNMYINLHISKQRILPVQTIQAALVHNHGRVRSTPTSTSSLSSIERGEQGGGEEDLDSKTGLESESDEVQLVNDISSKIRQNARSYASKHKLKLVAISTSRLVSRSVSERHYHDDDENDDENDNGDDKMQFKFNLDEGIESYSESVSKACIEDGINYKLWRAPGGNVNADTIVRQVDNLIERANTMPGVHGVLIYYPLVSTRPECLGWNLHSHNKRCSNSINTTNNNNSSNGNNTWSREVELMHIEQGHDEIFRRNQTIFPGLCYKTRDDFYRRSIRKERDVEGLCPHHLNHSRIKNVRGDPSHLYIDSDTYTANDDIHIQSSDDNDMIFPCTALAVVKILRRIYSNPMTGAMGAIVAPSPPAGKRFDGMTITIINRSQILGRPLASLLSNDGATVYSIDKDSILLYNNRRVKRLLNSFSSSSSSPKDMEFCVREAQVIITAVPSSTFQLPATWIQSGSTVINVASQPNIDEEELRSVVPEVFYVPQIGRVTVSLLEHNLVTLHRRHHDCKNDFNEKDL